MGHALNLCPLSPMQPIDELSHIHLICNQMSYFVNLSMIIILKVQVIALWKPFKHCQVTHYLCCKILNGKRPILKEPNVASIRRSMEQLKNYPKFADVRATVEFRQGQKM